MGMPAIQQSALPHLPAGYFNPVFHSIDPQHPTTGALQSQTSSRKKAAIEGSCPVQQISASVLQAAEPGFLAHSLLATVAYGTQRRP